MVVCGERVFATIITAARATVSTQYLAVVVVVVALGRSLSFLYFPVASSLLGAAFSTEFISFAGQPNPSTASTGILPSLGAVRAAASMEFSVFISLKTSGIRIAVS